MADRGVPIISRRVGLAVLYCALCLCVGGAFIAASLPRPAVAVDTEAQQFILMDAGTGMVLAEKNSDEPMYPASMSKIMTLYVAYEHLADGRLSMEDTFVVSKKAWRMKGSRMFVEVNSKVTVGELLRGIAVQSGNDASLVIAEGLAGSEAAFADLMNETGAELGLDDSHFVNSTGWPDPDHITTARDMAELSRRIIADFPEYYPLFAEKSYTYNGIKQGNRNPLLYRFNGADGLKTGYTQASGHGLAASAKRGEQRLVLVVNGINGVDVRGARIGTPAQLRFSFVQDLRPVPRGPGGRPVRRLARRGRCAAPRRGKRRRADDAAQVPQGDGGENPGRRPDRGAG